MKYTDLPATENPRTRIREVGSKALSLAETLSLALFLNETDTADALAKLVREFGLVSRIPRHRITEIKGLGEKYADAIEAIAEITRREVQAQSPDRVAVHQPVDAAEYIRYEMASLDHEELRVILLDVRNKIIRVTTVARGSTSGASVRIGECFRDAIRENASSIILVHNHPSGDPTPSPEDVALTRAVVQAGKTMDIEVMDHLVIGINRWVSLREKGMGF